MKKYFNQIVPTNHALYIIALIAFSVMVIFFATSQKVSGGYQMTFSTPKPHLEALSVPSEVVESVASEQMGQIMTISHYSEKDSCHYPKDGGCLTASGKIAETGMVATNLYPFGTKLLIDGKEYTVEDRISAKYKNRIDIWVGYGEESHQLALKLGIKHLPIQVL